MTQYLIQLALPEAKLVRVEPSKIAAAAILVVLKIKHMTQQ